MRSKALAVRYLAMAVAFGLMLLSAGSIAPVAFGEPGGGATLPLLMKGHARADANAAGRPGAPTWDPQSAVRAMNGDPWAVPDRPVAGPRPATPARRAALATGTNRYVAPWGNDTSDCISSYCLTIGHAIQVAADGDSIWIYPATYTETLQVTKSLTFEALGGGNPVIDGNGGTAVFHISGNPTVSFQNLTIQNGEVGISIISAATVDLIDIIVQNNSATSSNGSGIANYLGTVDLTNVTVQNNSTAASGGGIYNRSGTVNSTNTIVAGNSAGG